MVLNRPSSCSTQMVGTTAGGTIRPARISTLITGLSRLAAALPDVGDHGAEDDHGGDAHHGEDHAVDEGDDHQVVPGRERLRQVVEQDEVRRPGELQQVRLG